MRKGSLTTEKILKERRLGIMQLSWEQKKQKMWVWSKNLSAMQAKDMNKERQGPTVSSVPWNKDPKDVRWPSGCSLVLQQVISVLIKQCWVKKKVLLSFEANISLALNKTQNQDCCNFISVYKTLMSLWHHTDTTQVDNFLLLYQQSCSYNQKINWLRKCIRI